MWSRHFNFLMSIIDQPLINIIKNKRGGNLPVCSIVSTLFMVKSVLGCSNPKLNRVKVFLSTTPLDLRHIFTGRNEVLAKVIFLHLFVILFTGEVWQGEPPGLGEHPPWHGEPPQTRHIPCRRQTPPGMETPPGKQTPAYGLRSAGTHPTGMHSCSSCLLFSVLHHR